MKRYDPTEEMVPDANGDWVSHEDALAAVQTERAKLDLIVRRYQPMSYLALTESEKDEAAKIIIESLERITTNGACP